MYYVFRYYFRVHQFLRNLECNLLKHMLILNISELLVSLNTCMMQICSKCGLKILENDSFYPNNNFHTNGEIHMIKIYMETI